MEEVKELISYANGDSRNKIIFSRRRFDGLKYIDVGLEISKIMGNSPEEISGIDTLYRQVFNRASLSDDIGAYLAIENIGILFEPDMHLNLESILDTYSKGEVLIINAPGEIVDNTYHFFAADSHFVIDLEGLSYKSI